MSNVPPGAFMLPYATTFCEWLVRLAGGIATCVESSEMVVDYMVTHGAIPVSAGEDITLTNDLIARGQASAQGATDSVAASQQMARLGIPNQQYGADWFAANDFVPVVQAALRRGVPVLFGIYAAHNLHDDWTNQNMDAGVDGHGIAIVGMDSTGAICADPNTVQAQSGDFVHYSWANLRGAEGSYPSMVIPEGVLMLDISQVSDYFVESQPEVWHCTKTGFDVQHGILDFFRTVVVSGCWLGLPKENARFIKSPAAGKSDIYLQLFERGGIAFDPDRQFDAPPGAVGPCYLFHVDDPKFNSQLAAVESQVSQDAANIAGLEAEIAKLSSAAPTKTPADIVAALAAATSLLAPFAQAAAEVAKAQTEVVS